MSSGSVSINEDASVQILAEEVHKVEDLDAAAARDIVAKAQSKVASASDEVGRNSFVSDAKYIFWLCLSQVAKAEAQIELEVGEALVAACS